MKERRADAKVQKAKISAGLWLAIGAVVIVLIVAVAISVANFLIADRVNSNAHRLDLNAGTISRNSDRIEAVERRDRDSLRAASYRICEREMRDRAEQHLRAGLSPPAVIAKLVHQLGLPSKLAREVSIEAVRRRLPISDCKPNLIGKRATPLSAKRQGDYVRRYAEGKLAPSP